MRGGCFGVTIGIGGCGVAETLPSLRSTLPHTGGLLLHLTRRGWLDLQAASRVTIRQSVAIGLELGAVENGAVLDDDRDSVADLQGFVFAE